MHPPRKVCKAHLATVIRVTGSGWIDSFPESDSSTLSTLSSLMFAWSNKMCVLFAYLTANDRSPHTHSVASALTHKREGGIPNTWDTERIWLHVSHKKGGEESSSPKPLVCVGLPWWIRWLLYGLPVSSRQSLCLDWNRISSFKLLSEVLASNPELCWSLKHLSDSPSKMRFLPTR